LLPDRTGRRILAADPDIIHLHWINAGFLSIGSLSAFEKPIVWTMHDMWPITGGCHYAGRCRRFESNCGRCPALGSSRSRDLSRLIWDKKSAMFDGLDLTVVTPSTWLAEQAAKSSLFEGVDIQLIPNGIDTSLYSPYENTVAKEELKLNSDSSKILFGAANIDDQRKGAGHLFSAIRNLHQRISDFELVLFGTSESGVPDDLVSCTRNLGRITDEQLRRLYSAADVYVVPSLEDNLPNTVMESMAAGTPVVGYDTGGIGDMIEHAQTGYLAEHGAIDDLADGIAWVLDDPDRREHLGRQARARAEERYNIETVAHQYHALYEDILA
jgi:glycosyltransferase involved in cell wall biosynthesis